MQRCDLNGPDAPPLVAAFTQAIEVDGSTLPVFETGVRRSVL